MSAASNNLRTNQRQLDMDGCEVGVSRQAVEETLAEYDAMLGALRDLESALRTDSRDKSIIGDEVEYHISGQTMSYTINLARDAIAKASGT